LSKFQAVEEIYEDSDRKVNVGMVRKSRKDFAEKISDP
jgi:hypothetical protein